LPRGAGNTNSDISDVADGTAENAHGSFALIAAPSCPKRRDRRQPGKQQDQDCECRIDGSLEDPTVLGDRDHVRKISRAKQKKQADKQQRRGHERNEAKRQRDIVGMQPSEGQDADDRQRQQIVAVAEEEQNARRDEQQRADLGFQHGKDQSDGKQDAAIAPSGDDQRDAVRIRTPQAA